MKIRVISTILLLAMLLTACASTTIETQIQPTPTEEATPTSTVKATPTPMPTRIEDIGRIVYQFGIVDRLQDVLEPVDEPVSINQLLQPRGVIEDDVPKNITWEYNGIEFELGYWHSSMFIFAGFASDIYCDVYAIKINGEMPPGLMNFVAFKHDTSQLISCWLDQVWDQWPESNLNTLEDYVGLIKKTAGESVDFSKYELTCVTEYKDKEGVERTVDKYYEVNEDEEFICYEFYYTLKNGENDTGNQIYFMYRNTLYKNSSYQSYIFKNGISDYSYNEVINVTDEELEESRKLISEYGVGNSHTDIEFIMLDALYGRYILYLIMNIMMSVIMRIFLRAVTSTTSVSNRKWRLKGKHKPY